MISKDEFVKAIEELQWKKDYDDRLNRFFKDNEVECQMYPPDLSSTVIRLLHIQFGDADKDELIENFIFYQNFGRDSGKSAEDLYNDLINKL